MFCCMLLYVHSSITIILMGKRELVALLNLSSWCLVMVERLFLAVPWGCLRFVIVAFPDHTHLLFFSSDPQIVSKFHNKTHDPKGQENTIYTIVKGRETFYRRHTVPVTSCSQVKYVLKMVSFGSKDCTKEMKLECAYFLGQTS